MLTATPHPLITLSPAAVIRELQTQGEETAALAVAVHPPLKTPPQKGVMAVRMGATVFMVQTVLGAQDKEAPQEPLKRLRSRCMRGAAAEAQQPVLQPLQAGEQAAAEKAVFIRLVALRVMANRQRQERRTLAAERAAAHPPVHMFGRCPAAPASQLSDGGINMNEFKKAIILFDEGSGNKGEVINIIVCDQRGMQGLRLPANQTLWDCTQYGVAIGDRWEDGVFTRDGEAVEPIETVEQQLAAFKVEQEEQNSQIAYIGMMTEVL